MIARSKNHFGEEEWADFVNSRISEDLRGKMQGHLDTKCKSCSKSFEVWQLVKTAAKRESQYVVPEWAVRHVRNSFAVAAKPSNTKREFHIPKLLFDSFWQPALAGTRSAVGATRQMRYRFDDILIDLQLEPETDSDRISLVGQLSDVALKEDGLSDVPVLVTGTDGKVQKTSTNRFGEFQVSFAREKNLQLSIGVPDGKDLAIPLDVKSPRSRQN